jgi:hypothetical protein
VFGYCKNLTEKALLKPDNQKLNHSLSNEQKQKMKKYAVFYAYGYYLCGLYMTDCKRDSRAWGVVLRRPSDLFSSILAKIQVLMLQNDISELQNNPNFSIDASNTIYVIFMIIGIVGYFTIPTVAGWIISAGGMGAYNKNLQTTAAKTGAVAGAAAGAVSGNISGRLVK